MVETIKGRVFKIAIVWGNQAAAPSGLARSLIIEIEVVLTYTGGQSRSEG